jgi:hypothetical protein
MEAWAAMNASQSRRIDMTNEEYAKGLRLIADFFEKHPDIQVPYDADRFSYFEPQSREEMARVASALGTCEKVFDMAFLGSFALHKQFGLITFRAITNRSDVCTKRVVGTRHVPAVIVPASLIPSHDEEIVEWDCESILKTKY